MTIGQILPDVLLECGIDVVSPDITSTDFQMRQIKSLMDAAGRDINTRHQWSGCDRTASVVVGANSLDLPDGFQELSDGGAITYDNNFAVFLPVVSESMWEVVNNHLSDRVYYHIRQGKIRFSIKLTDSATVRFTTKQWLGNRETINGNDNETSFPEDLLIRGTVWRWRRQKGLPYEDLLAEFEADLEAAIRADEGIK